VSPGCARARAWSIRASRKPRSARRCPAGPCAGDAGRQHVRGNAFTIRRSKTGTAAEIAILPELRDVLDTMHDPLRLTFLTNEHGKPFTAKAFGCWFRRACDKAGIPKGYLCHGLRKAAATRFAMNGATAHELMAWFGWKTVEEAQRYTLAADRRRLAQTAAAKLTSVRPVPLAFALRTHESV
jgi:integrase